MRFWKYIFNKNENLSNDLSLDNDSSNSDEQEFDENDMNLNSQDASSEESDSQDDSSKNDGESSKDSDESSNNQLTQDNDSSSEDNSSSESNEQELDDDSMSKYSDESSNNESTQDSKSTSEENLSSEIDEQESNEDSTSNDFDESNDSEPTQGSDSSSEDNSSSESDEQESNEDSLSNDSDESSNNEPTQESESTLEERSSSESDEQESNEDSLSNDSDESSNNEPTQESESTLEERSSSESNEQESNEDSLSKDSDESSNSEIKQNSESSLEDNLSSESNEKSQIENNDKSEESDFKNNEESNTDKKENNNGEKDSDFEELKKDIDNDKELSEEQKQRLYEKLKKSIEEIRNRKAAKLHKENIDRSNDNEEIKDESPKMDSKTNQFLNQLGELPSFENRDRGDGYSIDTITEEEVPDSLIRTLITRFLNQRFCKKDIDLNIRSNSLKKTQGFYKWEVKDVIVHLQTHQVTKVLTDKYGYQYADGKNENVPLSFYFDLSGSMSNYTSMLAVIVIELLKKGVKVLVGYNEVVNVQIDSIDKNITTEELVQILEEAGCYSIYEFKTSEKFVKTKYKIINKNIDRYLIDSKGEKCVVFSDFDPLKEVINLSHHLDLYWFCFENSFSKDLLKGFNGFIYMTQNLNDLALGLTKVSTRRFDNLCYLDNPEEIGKRRSLK